MPSPFEALVGCLNYSMFIVTARAGDERLGCLIGFATQASIDPPRFLIGLSHTNRTHRVGGDSEYFAVHAVPAHADPLAQLFGGETQDETDKFARCNWHEGPHGLPILDECENWFVGRVLWRDDAGDHDLYLLEPVEANASAEIATFQFHRAKRIEAGHEP